MLIQPGVYATPTLHVAKTRGFNKTKLRYDDLLNAWLAHGMAGAIEIADTRFIGFGYALATGNMHIWRTWQSGSKRIGMGGTATKYPSMVSALDSRLLPLDCPSQPEAELSAVYVPRVRAALRTTDFDAQLALVAEQPDFGDNEYSWS
jgi:hypothetical protein